MKYEKISLMVNVAKLYYENDFSQNMIAKKLNLSRPYVSKILNEAKEKGLVTITINDPDEHESNLEMEIRDKFGLVKVIVVPNNDESDMPRKVALSAARYLNSIIKSSDIIGVAWGTTIYELALNIVPRSDVKNIKVVQLCGGISNIAKNIYASEILKKISEAYQGSPYILPLPAIFENKKTKDMIIQDKNISHIMNLGKKANISIFTMGSFSEDSALARANYISSEEVERLKEMGAVGDIFSRIITIDGKICDKLLDERTIAIDIDEIKNKEYNIGIASGHSKVKAIYGALAGGYCNVLVTDEKTALEVLELKL
jgi:deoxyribonucleoside regulator